MPERLGQRASKDKDALPWVRAARRQYGQLNVDGVRSRGPRNDGEARDDDRWGVTVGATRTHDRPQLAA
jgi:hypothetical protein